MADRKITDLTALAAGSQATGDLLTIVDVSEAAATDKNKKITVESLFKGIPSNVGIGTSSPSNNLHVYDGSANTLLRVQSGTATARINIVDSAGQAFVSCKGDALTFDTSSSATERARIDSSGRLLVGTSSAIQTSTNSVLQLKHADGAQIILARDDSTIAVNQDIGAIRFYGNDGGSYQECARIAAEADGSHANNDKPTALRFYTTADDESSPTERLRIDSSGNVGIGTTSPSSQLTISNAAAPTVTLIDTTNTCTSIFASGNTEGRVGTSSNHDFVFRTNNSERMRIDSSGRLLVGTSSAVNTNTSANLQLVHVDGPQFIFARNDTTTTDNEDLGLIRFYGNDSDGNYDECARIAVEAEGAHTSTSKPSYMRFFTAASGAESPTERLRIDSSGNVGIGTTSPGARLEVKGADSAGYAAQFTNSSESRFAKIYVDGNGIALVDDNFDDGIEFASNTARIYANGSERMRIDSSGRLMLGTTTSKSTAGKIQAYTSSGDLNLHIQSDGLASGNAAYLNVNAKKSGGSTSHNAQIGLYKHSGINDVSAYLNLSNLDNRFMWNDTGGTFRISNSASHIGTTNGTVVGTQTSDERLKNVGADVAYGLTEIKQLQAKQYALKTDPNTNKLGFIAQQVESIIPEAVFDTNEELDGHEDGDRTKLGMEYVQLIPVLVNAIKELSAEVDTLKTKVAALEAG